MFPDFTLHGIWGLCVSSMGPFPVEDSFGMGAAIVMLDLSLRPGVNDRTVQFNTIRKFRSTFSNLHHASVKGQEGGSNMSNGVKKQRYPL